MHKPWNSKLCTSFFTYAYPSDAGRKGPYTRQQSTVDAMAQAAAAAAAAAAQATATNLASAASQGAQSVTTTIDYHSLATAMSRLNDDSASNLEKSTQPKWDFKTETFVDWQHKVKICYNPESAGTQAPGPDMRACRRRSDCYNPESAGSQAPGPDVCTRRRRSDIPCRGGQYVLTVVSRHYVACEN